MAPVGYFYSGEQFAEQPAASQLEDQAGDGVVRPPPSVAAARNRAVAVAVAFAVGLGAAPALGQAPTPAAAGTGHSFLHVRTPTAVSLAVSGDALPQAAAPSFVGHEYDGLVRPIVPTVPVRDAFTADPVFRSSLPTGADETGLVPETPPPRQVDTRVFTDTPELAITQPSLPTGADETGFQPPVPPMPGPVVPTFTDTPERVVPPDPIFGDTFHVQTFVHDPAAIHLQQSGDVLPTGEAPSAPPAPIYDAQPLTDPVVIEATPTVIFWIDQVLPGAGTDIAQYDDPAPLTNPVVVETVTPRVFTDQEILPGAVAPTQISQADDPLALARPVVPATTDTRVFTADQVLPRQPLGIHDEAGPAALHMFAVAPVVDVRVLGEDVAFVPEVVYVPVFPPNIVTVSRVWRVSVDRNWRTDSDRTWRTDG